MYRNDVVRDSWPDVTPPVANPGSCTRSLLEPYPDGIRSGIGPEYVIFRSRPDRLYKLRARLAGETHGVVSLQRQPEREVSGVRSPPLHSPTISATLGTIHHQCSQSRTSIRNSHPLNGEAVPLWTSISFRGTAAASSGVDGAPDEIEIVQRSFVERLSDSVPVPAFCPPPASQKTPR